jgi:hypothetical protein
MYPWPPRHSSASAAWAGVRLQIQYLSTGPAMRRKAAASALPAAASSMARLSRSAPATDPSYSSARSASTPAMAP